MFVCACLLYRRKRREGSSKIVEDVYKRQSVEKHPDADKLVVCQLDVGKGDSIQIVTGADNVFAGAVVPVALDGSDVYKRQLIIVLNKPTVLITVKKGRQRNASYAEK